MSKTICLIDGNSIGNASHNIARMTVGDMETQAIYQTCKFARRFIEEYPTCGFLWLWDSRAQWRFDIYPDYKSNRKPKDEKQAKSKEQYHNQRPYIEKALYLLGMAQMRASDYEADDLAGWLTSTMDNPLVLVTGDMDWAQLVNDKTVFYDPIRDRHIGISNFFPMTGYKTPTTFLEGKCLKGDSSDCITGVGGIGEQRAAEFLAEFGGVELFFNQVADGTYKPKLKRELNLACGEGKERFHRNMKLMKLIGMKRPDKPSFLRGEFDRKSFEDLCYDLNFKSFLDDMDNWIEPFERVWNERRKD